MRDIDVMTKLAEIFRNLFTNVTLNLSRTTTAQDVAGWDSLMHINLIVAIEREFRIRFTTREITALRNVGDLVDLVIHKTSTS